MDAHRLHRNDTLLRNWDNVLTAWYAQHQIDAEIKYLQVFTGLTPTGSNDSNPYRPSYVDFNIKNPVRVPGTCEWFLECQRFLIWRKQQSPSLL
jgi:hypothetical protein